MEHIILIVSKRHNDLRHLHLRQRLALEKKSEWSRDDWRDQGFFAISSQCTITNISEKDYCATTSQHCTTLYFDMRSKFSLTGMGHFVAFAIQPLKTSRNILMK